MTDRAVSITVNYAMGLAIATLLLSSLLIVSGDVLEGRRESVVRTELEVIGERIAAGIESADRLVRAGGSTVDVTVRNPRRVSGRDYSIRIRATADGGAVVLRTTSPAVEVVVPFANQTAIRRGTAGNGDVRVHLAGGRLEVSGA